MVAHSPIPPIPRPCSHIQLLFLTLQPLSQVSLLPQGQEGRSYNLRALETEH